MAKGRWKFSDEQLAIEAYSVLIDGQRAGRTLPKGELRNKLKSPEIHRDFLKLCLEHDDSKSLAKFRKGLLVVAKAIGISEMAARVGLSRLSLYRMLAAGGNPRLSSLLATLEALGIRLWIVDQDFITRKKRVVRPKDMIRES